MTEWWNRPAPGEGWELEFDPEAGHGGWHYRAHLWLVPIRGALDLVRDLRACNLGFRHWFTTGVLIGALQRLG